MDTSATSPETPVPSAPAPDWAASGIGVPWQLRFFDRLIRHLGKRPAYHMMYLVTLWYCLLAPAIRRRTRHYLDRRFPGRGPGRRFLDSYRLLRSFGKTLVDLAACRIQGDQAFAVVVADSGRLEELGRLSTGVILVNAHVGCWQVALSALDRVRKPVNLVMLPDDVKRLPLKPAAARLIDPRTGLDGVVAMMQALRRGEILCLMGDRVFGEDQNQLAVPFLGEPAAFPVAPYRLAAATGAPVMVLLTRKRDFRTYEVLLPDCFTVPAGLGRQPAAYAEWVGRFAGLLARFVQEHPWDYFNFFDVWAKPGGPGR